MFARQYGFIRGATQPLPTSQRQPYQETVVHYGTASWWDIVTSCLGLSGMVPVPRRPPLQNCTRGYCTIRNSFEIELPSRLGEMIQSVIFLLSQQQIIIRRERNPIILTFFSASNLATITFPCTVGLQEVESVLLSLRLGVLETQSHNYPICLLTVTVTIFMHIAYICMTACMPHGYIRFSQSPYTVLQLSRLRISGLKKWKRRQQEEGEASVFLV